MSEGYDESEEADYKDPALEGFHPWVEKFKYVVGKILKFAAIGAVVGGLGLGAAAIMAGISLGGAALGAGGAAIGAGGRILPALASAGPWGAGVAAIASIGIGIASAIGLWNAGAVGGWVLSGLATAALAGVVIGVLAGAALGMIFGCSGMDDAADSKADQLRSNWELVEAKIREREQMAQQLRQQDIALAKLERQLKIHHGGMMPFLSPSRSQAVGT